MDCYNEDKRIIMKYLILGAGPAGLTFANKLKEEGETDFLILEREKEAGGLCRSVMVDDFPLDIGGGHFLDVRLPDVNTFLFHFMPSEEWELYERDSQIMINKVMIDYPFESNIWQLEIEEQVEHLKAIAVAGCTLNTEMPKKFIEWIYWKLGSKIAGTYMIPYNQKMFGEELEQLGTYWLDKLPNVSFEDVLRSCLIKKAYGKQPGHTQFYYPKKFGYGELWTRMADEIQDHIEYGAIVNAIDFNTNTVKTMAEEKYQSDFIITTIPWAEFKSITGMPEELQKSIKKLKSNSIQVEYFPNYLNTKAHWIYCPDKDVAYHRILVRHNFCYGSKGYWTETNIKNIHSLCSTGNFKYVNQYAYPFNTLEKPEIMKKLLNWSRERNVYGLGRWGEHQHYNSDVTVSLAIKLAEYFLQL